jgi:hypothetical protein
MHKGGTGTLNRDPTEQSMRPLTSVRTLSNWLLSLPWNTGFRRFWQESTIRVNLELLWPGICLARELGRSERTLAKGNSAGRMTAVDRVLALMG